MKNNITNNVLIAKFMGINVLQGKNSNNQTYFYYNNTELKDFEALPNYDSDWNYLMEVIEKIENLKNLDFNIKRGEYNDSDWETLVEFNIKPYSEIFVFDYLMCEEYKHKIHFQFESVRIDGSLSKIEKTYICVVEFIKWFNINKK